jgi:hypothetical protein
MPTTLHDATSSLACPPRWGTPRTESRTTYGPRVAEIGAALGTPFMPWQRNVADVALEVDSTTGLLAYREVVITIPRQSGKTTIGLAIRVHRALGFGGPQNLVYTAQTRNDARMKWEDEHTPMLENSPFAGMVYPRKRTGAEAFVWNNGSIDALPAPTAKAGHGKTLDLGFIDEAFAQTDDRLEQAFRPAMVTRPQPQLWIVSTAGTAESKYLRAKVQAGRRREAAGRPSRVAYFEWSAPNDADPMDPATWRSCMPARGHTITEDVIQAELDSMIQQNGADGLQLFRRAYLNQWVDEFPSGWAVIPQLAWQARAGASGRPTGQVVFAVAAAYPDAERTSIVVAGRNDAGEMLVQLVECREGTSWVPPRMRELRDTHFPAAVVVDAKGPAGPLIAALENVGVDVLRPGLSDVAHAAGMFYAGTAGDDPSYRHYGQKDLDDAVAAAVKRPLGEAWTWARKGIVDISPLEAASLAAWGVVVRADKGGGPNLW